MPDFFVPLDTSGVTSYFNQVARRNIIYRYAFEYTDLHRSKLSEFNDYSAIEEHLARQNLLNDFIAYAQKRGVKPNWDQINKSRMIIETQLMAYIARNLIDNEGFYPIIIRIDNTLLRAVEIIEDDEGGQLFSFTQNEKQSVLAWLKSGNKNRVIKDAVAQIA